MPFIPPKLDWRELERIARENDKHLTCPICGKKCRKFLAPNGPCMPYLAVNGTVVRNTPNRILIPDIISV